MMTIRMANWEGVWARWTPGLTNSPQLTQGAPNTQIKISYQDWCEDDEDDDDDDDDDDYDDDDEDQ